MYYRPDIEPEMNCPKDFFVLYFKKNFDKNKKCK
jgi:hypothetical protein